MLGLGFMVDRSAESRAWYGVPALWRVEKTTQSSAKRTFWPCILLSVLTCMIVLHRGRLGAPNSRFQRIILLSVLTCMIKSIAVVWALQSPVSNAKRPFRSKGMPISPTSVGDAFPPDPIPSEQVLSSSSCTVHSLTTFESPRTA